MAQTHQAKQMSAPVEVQPQPRGFWMRWRVRLGYPVAILYWMLATPTPRYVAYGAVVAALGLALRAAAAGYLRKDRELAVTGPYARTRNPLYLGSAILAAGFVVAGHSLVAGLLIAAYFIAFYIAVMKKEERDLRERFGAEFDLYAARVPLFFPSFHGVNRARTASERNQNANGNGEFSWAQYSRNREYRALLGTVAALGMVWLRMWLQAKYGF